jgi:hypothetical protein
MNMAPVSVRRKGARTTELLLDEQDFFVDSDEEKR